MTARLLKIGARGSPLSLAQSGLVARELERFNAGLVVEIIPIKTTGDKILDAPLAAIGGKGLFVKEIEEALLAGTIDLAIHSAKDLPAELPPGLILGPTPERADYRDVLITRGPGGLSGLSRGARVGTSGLRRKAQILAARPDLVVEPLRGNVGTRLEKIKREFDATLLAAAGLARLGVAPPHATPIEPEIMLPAVGQGVLALEIREGDEATATLLAPIHHEATAICLAAERGFLGRLGSGCQLPVAALAEIKNKRLTITALIAAPAGELVIRGRREEILSDQAAAASLGESLALELLDQGGREIMKGLDI